MNAPYVNWIRPSNMKRISICMGSAQIEAHCHGRLDRGEDAKEVSVGNAAHLATARTLTLLTHSADGDPLESLGDVADALETVRQGQDGAAIDGWTWTCVIRAVEFVVALIKQYDVECGNVLIEHRMDGRPLGLDLGGTADVVLVVPGKQVIVVDHKFGFLDQGDASEHDQLSVYACMVARDFHAEKVIVYLSAPRMEEGRRYSSAIFDRKTIAATAVWMESAAYLARQPDAELVPGFDHCQHCNALPFCPAVKEFIVNATEAIAKKPVPETPTEWADYLNTAKLADKFASVCIGLAKGRLQEGHPITGWEIGPPVTTRDLEDARAVHTACSQVGAEDAFWSAAKVSRTELEKSAPNLRDMLKSFIVEGTKAGSLRQVKAVRA